MSESEIRERLGEIEEQIDRLQFEKENVLHKIREGESENGARERIGAIEVEIDRLRMEKRDILHERRESGK